MGDLHDHKKIDLVIDNDTSTVLLPHGTTFYLGILNGADIYLNGVLLAYGIHYTEIANEGLGVGFSFEEDEIKAGDCITISYVEYIDVVENVGA